jgi:hypothetical protein
MKEFFIALGGAVAGSIVTLFWVILAMAGGDSHDDR